MPKYDQCQDSHTYSDQPLSFNWLADESILDSLNLAPKNNQRAVALRGMIGATVIAAEAGRWVAYSRRQSWYVGLPQYYGNAFTYSNITAAIEELAQAGLIEEERAAPGSYGKWQSRFRASPKLLTCPPNASPGVAEPLRLRGLDGGLIPYAETARTSRLRRELNDVNDYLGAINLTIDGPGVTRTAHHWITAVNAILVVPQPCVHRGYLRGSWNLGGRLYGFWQNLPGTLRDQLRINGEPVARPDYKQMHPAMLLCRSQPPIARGRI
jgi:hypothetical protein